jgi:hypothetical protein
MRGSKRRVVPRPARESEKEASEWVEVLREEMRRFKSR